MKYTMNNRKGFTLVEILVVIALTIIILGLVFGPVISTFNFTRRAEVMVRAQDNARFALEQVSRELADAMFIYDNTNQPINFPMIDASGSLTNVSVLYAKVDIVLPKMRAYCTSPTHGNTTREFMRHDPDLPELDEAIPSCPAQGCGAPLELRPAQPLAADKLIVRYFIGLRDPSLPYANGYTNKFSQGADNMYVLYRAEFSPFDATPDPATQLFQYPDAAHFAENMRNPNFFYDPQYSAAWRKISRPVVSLENVDLIVQEFQSGAPVYNAAGQPVLTPTVKFMPTAVYNDPLLPTSDFGGDAEHGSPLPTVYKATYGYWTTPIEVTLSGKRDDNSGNPVSVTYRAIRPAPSADRCIAEHSCILYNSAGDPIFNISHYLATKTGRPSDAPNWGGYKYGVGEFPSTKPDLAFTIDETRGTVDFAFPVVNISASDSLSGPTGKMAVSLIANTDQINLNYKNTGSFRDRYRSLFINDPSPNTADGYTTTPSPIALSTVVPGSERVVAPDSAPGLNYRRPIRYGRVPSYLYEPGLNQYQLDTDYQAVDNNGDPIAKPGLACLFFHSYQTQQPGSGVELPPGTEDIPPRKPGMDPVYVYYEVQNNKKGDTLRASYVTKSLMSVIMGIRIYDPSSGKPQAIQLTNKVRLRNIAQ